MLSINFLHDIMGQTEARFVADLLYNMLLCDEIFFPHM